MRRLLARILESPAYRVLGHLSTIHFVIGMVAALTAAVASKMHGKPLEVILAYGFGVGAAALVVTDYCIKGYRRLRHKEEEIPTTRRPSPNIIFSHCRSDVLGQPSALERDDIRGGLLAEFYNDVSDPHDRADGVVAHLAYFKQPTREMELKDPIWKTISGLWEPSHHNYQDFEMNGIGRLVLGVILSDGSYPERLALYGVGYHDISKASPYGLDLCSIEDYLPVVTKVTLRGHGFKRKFAFRLSKRKEWYECEQLPTPNLVANHRK